MMSLTPHKSEHYVLVMELMLFENVCSEWLIYSARTALFPQLENAGIKIKGTIIYLLFTMKFLTIM